MYDRILRGGTLVDGTGAKARSADVAIEGGQIREVGRVTAAAREIIDASGLVVTPGFVDIHTHYDGQATWDPQLAPSCFHGVTTVVMGNCGVGFAPVRPGQEEYLIGLMEGVEDIPGTALHEGIQWEWETFPQYLEALDRRQFAMDLATQVPHGSVRAYVMGERGARNEPATSDDIASMAALVKEGLLAGALGFSTSRTSAHRAITGEPVPGTFAAEDELFGIGRVLGELGRGIFEVAGAGAAGEDLAAPRRELDWMRRLSREIGRPVTFALVQVDPAPNLWRELLDLSARAAEEGAQVYPQVAGRPFGMLVGHQTQIHPFADRPTYLGLLALSFEERIARMREPNVKRKILAERNPATLSFLLKTLHRVFPIGNPPQYEPASQDSIESMALREGRDPEELLYDQMLEQDGRELHPRAALGLGDGGAHCGIICDASIQTFMLTHWVRDRQRGPRVPLELAVRRMTHDTATLYGLCDRGVVAPGQKADLNLIDFENLQLEPPQMVFDLPAGGRRFVQRARGYVATLVSGEFSMRGDEPTGELPGRLVRGVRAAASAAPCR